MKESYSIYEVTRTICIEVDKDAGSSHVSFEFAIMIMKLKNEEYTLRVYRNESYSVKTISGVDGHEEILVRGFFFLTIS
jgi:hypothetical protein